ncbi:hypothetical protein [Corynebacterium hadale]|uniref:hypothetical protein n=1 Tax=Corynebacterium hadale TaxID=2026255 RepID=UPI000BAA7C5C|nr:hypothetical protein [Corynebacterium hadale]PAT09287.1 hypothetical protein CKJ82_00930 [Corynebacterium hadale]
MTWLAVCAAVAVTAFLAWAYFTAQRLDRLHMRVDRSRDALQAALDRRCAVVAATLPALRDQARVTEEARLDPRDIAHRLRREDALSAALTRVQEHESAGSAPEVAHSLRDAETRVFLALRFYNEAVSDTRALRLRPLVRALHLGGTAALPEYATMTELEGPAPARNA